MARGTKGKSSIVRSTPKKNVVQNARKPPKPGRNNVTEVIETVYKRTKIIRTVDNKSTRGAKSQGSNSGSTRGKPLGASRGGGSTNKSSRGGTKRGGKTNQGGSTRGGKISKGRGTGSRGSNKPGVSSFCLEPARPLTGLTMWDIGLAGRSNNSPPPPRQDHMNTINFLNLY